jgi:hypothetical protein
MDKSAWDELSALTERVLAVRAERNLRMLHKRSQVDAWMYRWSLVQNRMNYLLQLKERWSRIVLHNTKESSKSLAGTIPWLKDNKVKDGDWMDAR